MIKLFAVTIFLLIGLAAPTSAQVSDLGRFGAWELEGERDQRGRMCRLSQIRDDDGTLYEFGYGQDGSDEVLMMGVFNGDWIGQFENDESYTVTVLSGGQRNVWNAIGEEGPAHAGLTLLTHNMAIYDHWMSVDSVQLVNQDGKQISRIALDQNFKNGLRAMRQCRI